MVSRSHHTQSIKENSVHKLIFGHVQILEIQCPYTKIMTYQSTVSIIKVHIFAKLRK